MGIDRRPPHVPPSAAVSPLLSKSCASSSEFSRGAIFSVCIIALLRTVIDCGFVGPAARRRRPYVLGNGPLDRRRMRGAPPAASLCGGYRPSYSHVTRWSVSAQARNLEIGDQTAGVPLTPRRLCG